MKKAPSKDRCDSVRIFTSNIKCVDLHLLKIEDDFHFSMLVSMVAKWE